MQPSTTVMFSEIQPKCIHIDIYRMEYVSQNLKCAQQLTAIQ